MPQPQNSDVKSPILLTIGIPTFRRPRYLRHLLEQIQSEIKGLSGIEILVSDNASGDQTIALLIELRKKMPLRYQINSENIGVDRNTIAIIRSATGRYLWMVGDDDLFVPGAIRRVHAALSKLDPSVGVLFLNYYEFQSKQTAYGRDSDETRIMGWVPGDRNLMIAAARTGSFGSDILLTSSSRWVVEHKLKVQADGTVLKVMPKTGLRNAFDIYLQTYFAMECARHSGQLGIVFFPCMTPQWDGGYYGAELTLIALQRNLDAMRDFGEYFPDLIHSNTLGLGSTPYRILQFFIYFDPDLDASSQRSLYRLADQYIIYYRKLGNRYWPLFWLLRQMHGHLPFFNRLFWCGYTIFNRFIRGRGTFSDYNKTKKDAGVRASEW